MPGGRVGASPEEGWRADERRALADPSDQAALARAIAGRRRAEQPVPLALLESRALPARTFTSSEKLTLLAILPDGRETVLGRTNVAGAGDTIQVPEHRALVVEPDSKLAPAKLARVLNETGATGAALVLEVKARKRPTFAPTEALANVPALERLRLEGHTLLPTDLSRLATLPSLAFLELVRVVLGATKGKRSFEATLAQLPALVSLRLRPRSPSRADLGALGSLPALERLEVWEQSVSAAELQGLAKAPALRSLRFYHTPGVDRAALEVLSACPRLESLGLDSCFDVTPDFLVATLGRFEGLRSLELAFVAKGGLTLEVTRAIAKLSRLRELHLDGCRELTDEGLATLASCLPELEHLDLRIGEKLEDAGLAALKALPKLRRLRLAHTKIGDRGLEHVAKIEGLEALDLDGATECGDAGLAKIAKLPRLSRLDLWGTKTTEKGLAALAEHARGLEELRLGACKDEWLEPIARIGSLRRLRVEAHGLTPAGIARLASLANLADLHLFGADRLFTKTALKPFTRARPGCRIHGDMRTDDGKIF